MNHFAGKKGKGQTETTAHVETLSVEDKLKFAIINGEKAVGEGAHKKTLEEMLEEALDPIFAARPDQQRPARRHAHGGRPVWRAQDAVAVGARLRRRDEAGGRLSRAQDGEEGRLAEGHDRAGHGEGRCPRHWQEPGRHHSVEQRLQGGQPGHQADRRHHHQVRAWSTRPMPSD